MTASWAAGTYVVVAARGEAKVTVVIDGSTSDVEQLVQATTADGFDISDVEIRASFAGPSRTALDVVGEISVVVQLIALGAAGSGLWAAVQALIEKAAARHSIRRPASEAAAPQQIVTVMIPTERGPALVQQVTSDDRGAVDIVSIIEALIGSGPTTD